MKIINKINIKQKLILNFSFSVISLLLVLSVAGFFVNSIGDLLNTLYKHPLSVSNSANDINTSIYKIQSDIKSLNSSDTISEKTQYLNDIDKSKERIYTDLDSIRSSILGEEGKQIEIETRKIIENWIPMIDQMKENRIDQSSNIETADLRSQEEAQVKKIEEKSMEIKKNANDKASSFVDKGSDTKDRYEIVLVVVFFGTITVLLFIFIITLKSIIKSINSLKKVILHASNTGVLEYVEYDNKDEISDMSEAYNWLVEKINDELWIKEGQAELNGTISGELSLSEFSNKATAFLARYLNAGSSVLYIYDENRNNLKLQGSFAFTQNNMAKRTFEMGEGSIGQVALERKAILQSNIKPGEAMITTGFFSETPISTYAFPLEFESKLLAVIELAFFQNFDMTKSSFIEEISRGMSTTLFTLIQSIKIKELLEETKTAKDGIEEYNLELRIRTEETQKINSQLEEQQQLLTQQSEELQKTNTQMEEQQQLLQQQAEELQQSNSQLEEQQQTLKQQSEEVKEKNENLTEIQKELEIRALELEASSNYKSEFLANMSHELRTPLNSIILLSKLFTNNNGKNLSKKDIEKMEIINRSGKELLRLINDILDLSKLEAGKVELNYTCFNSYDLIEDIKDNFISLAEEKGIEFVCEDNLNKNINSDRERISQIISNFLSNSFKFTENGKVSLKIEVGENDEYPIVISVKDTGIGIPKAKQQKVFEAFEQMDSSISRKYGGTGLGLSIAQVSASLLKGKIKLKSEEGLGSEFSLLLPDYEKLEDLISADLETKNVYTNVKYVMLVEDNFVQSDAIKELIENDEIKIITAAEESEAKKLMETYDFDAVITDLRLKSGNGLDLCKYIKEKNEELPIIVYTGRDVSFETELEEKLKKYASKIIIKTVNSIERLQDELIVLINRREETVSEKEQSYLYNKLKINKGEAIKDSKVLIVDDDPKNVYVLAAALEDYGVNVLQAENGKKALEKLKNERVDLVLMDIMMPVMDGYECMGNIRSKEEYKDLPIIALTAKALKGDKEKCIEAGANDYISKPVDYDVLISLINAWITK